MTKQELLEGKDDAFFISLFLRGALHCSLGGDNEVRQRLFMESVEENCMCSSCYTAYYLARIYQESIYTKLHCACAKAVH